MKISRVWGVLCLGFALGNLSAIAARTSESDLQAWIDWEKGITTQNMFYNISPNGAAPGAVVASPSRDNPNYFKHWVRDASLTMNLVISYYENTQDQNLKNTYYQRMMDFTDFSRRNQLTDNPSGGPGSNGLGEPLFMPDGSPFNQGWGRPQNDGPALRAMVLTRWAFVLLSQGQESLVRQKFYDGQLPANTVIKADLEYVSHHLDESCFDLWEEVRGYHFYTRMVQRKALLDGARLADRLGDGGAANWYRQEASVLEAQINTHWDNSRKVILTTLGRDGGMDYKNSGLDASTILALMHGDTGDGFFPVYDDRAMATAVTIANIFKSEFPINGRGPGIGIGRYPEDQYDGNGAHPNGGNPWVLLTNGFGEYYYRVSKGLSSKGNIAFNDTNVAFFRDLAPANASSIVPGKVIHSNDTLFNSILGAAWQRGDDYLMRTRFHTGSDGGFAEQMNRDSGFMQGAKNLTWSDASFLVAAWERSGF